MTLNISAGVCTCVLQVCVIRRNEPCDTPVGQHIPAASFFIRILQVKNVHSFMAAARFHNHSLHRVFPLCDFGVLPANRYLSPTALGLPYASHDQLPMKGEARERLLVSA